MQPDFNCPACGSDRLKKKEHRNGTYRCQNCNAKTHEKIEANRGALETLADTDLPIKDLARKLVYPEKKDG